MTRESDLQAFISEKLSGQQPLIAPPAADRGGDGFRGGRPESWKPEASSEAADEAPASDEPGQTLDEARAEALRREPTTELDRFIQRTFDPGSAPADEAAAAPADEGSDLTLADFFDATFASEAELVAAGSSPAAHLAWAASCSPDEWAASCAQSGWPIDVRPSRAQLPRSVNALIDSAAFAADMAKMQESGRRIL